MGRLLINMGRYKQTKQEQKNAWKQSKLGKENINKQGFKMTVIDYIDYEHITVQFEDGLTKNTSFSEFRKGNVCNTNYKEAAHTPLKIERMNEMSYNKNGEKMYIKEYNNCADILVEFCDEYHGQVHTSYESFRKGLVRNPNKKGKYGQITGNEYKTRDENGEKTKEYNIWMAIIKRVFKAKEKNAKNTLYKDVKICDEWMYFPNFVKWLKEQSNYDKWKQGTNHEWSIDKDILSSLDNKIYSPETCCLVPSYINSSVIDVRCKDKTLPVGVMKFSNKYYYYFDNEVGKNQYFETIEETQESYINYKNNKRKHLAQKAYDNKDITEKCYNALMDNNFMYR